MDSGIPFLSGISTRKKKTDPPSEKCVSVLRKEHQPHNLCCGFCRWNRFRHSVSFRHTHRKKCVSVLRKADSNPEPYAAGFVVGTESGYLVNGYIERCPRGKVGFVNP